MKKKILLFAALSGLTAGTASAQFIDIQSSGMETWNDTTLSGMSFTSVNLQSPDGWNGSDLLIAYSADLANNLLQWDLQPAQQLFQSSDAHSGQYAAEIQTRFLGDSLGIMTGALSNAEFQFDITALLGGADLEDALTYSGGEPITGQVDSVSAWIKMDANNTDDGGMLVQAVKTYTGSNGDSAAVVGEGYFTIPSATTTTYTQFAVPVSYPDPNVVPDHLVVVFTSSSITGTQTADNSMKVDDVAYSYAAPNSIWQPLLSENKLLVYPVPAGNLIYFNLGAKEDPAQYHLQITDLQGRIISEKQLISAVNSENVSQWARGTYFYSLSNVKTGIQEQGKFILK